MKKPTPGYPVLTFILSLFLAFGAFAQEPVMPPDVIQSLPWLQPRRIFPGMGLPSQAAVSANNKSLNSARMNSTLEWENMKEQSEGGDAQDIVKVGNKLFMSSQAELFESSDNGESWKVVIKAGYLLIKGYMPNYYYGADKKILVSGDSILFGQQLSTDKGNTWKPFSIVQSTLPTYYFAPTVMSMRGKELYLGTYYNGVLKSTDFGKTFTELNTALPSICNLYETPRVIEFHNGKVVVATIGGIYSWGDEWAKHGCTNLPLTNINGGSGYLVDGIDFVGDAWIASTNYGVYRSDDEGETWQKFGALPDLTANSWALYSKPAIFYRVDVKGESIYASFDNNIWISQDGGDHWIHTHIDENVDVHRVYAGNDFILAMTSGGVFRSTDNGQHWKRSSTGFDRVYFGSIYSDGKEAWISSGHRGIFYSNDGGKSWGSRNDGFKSGFTFLNAAKGDAVVASTLKTYIYGGTLGGYNAGTYKMDHTSGQWEASGAWPVDRVFDLAISGSGTFAAVGSLGNQVQSGMHISSDQGKTWQKVFMGVTHNTLQEDYVSSIHFASDTLYVGTAASGIYRSADNGQHWTSITSAANGWKFPLTDADFLIGDLAYEVDQILAYHDNLFALVSLVSGDRALYYSHDRGVSWAVADLSAVSDGKIPYGQTMTMSPEGTLFLAGWKYDGTYISALWASDDNGQTWYQHGDDFPGTYVSGAGVIGNYVYLAGTYGLYRIPYKEIKSASIYSKTIRAERNVEVSVPVLAGSFQEIVRSDFSMHWDPAVVTYLGADSYGLAGMDASSFGNSAATGALTFSWKSQQPQTLPDGSVLFNLRFRLSGMPGDTTAFLINSFPLPMEMKDKYNRSIETIVVPGSIGIINLITSAEKTNSLVCYPVPFDRTLSIAFNSETSQEVEMRVTDVTGRQIHAGRMWVSEGSNVIQWASGETAPAGMYIVDVNTGTGAFRVKVVKR